MIKMMSVARCILAALLSATTTVSVAVGEDPDAVAEGRERGPCDTHLTAIERQATNVDAVAALGGNGPDAERSGSTVQYRELSAKELVASALGKPGSPQFDFAKFAPKVELTGASGATYVVANCSR